MTDERAIVSTIRFGRGKQVRIVGRVAGDALNFDVYGASGDAMFTELTREHARAVRDALNRFLGETP